MSKKIEAARGGEDGRWRRLRGWLRRIMPRVASIAALLLFLWLLIHEQPFYQNFQLLWPLGLFTFIVVSITVLYYGPKGFLWAKRKLLWRVRRRLVVTYLFVGLTPIVLLTTLGLLFAISISFAEQPRIVVMHMEELKREVLANARTLRE